MTGALQKRLALAMSHATTSDGGAVLKAMATTRDGPLAPGSCIGILGGGQLGRMLALAAARIGLRTAVYSEPGENPAFDVTPLARAGDYADKGGLSWLAQTADVITFEFENVPVDTAAFLADQCPVLPGVRALEIAQDRLTEKSFITAAGLPVAPHWEVNSTEDLEHAVTTLGAAGILKTRRLGYDGKGQVAVRPGDDLGAALDAIGGAAAVLEARIDFDGELSVLVVRARDGKTVAYDVPENEHSGGILRCSRVPSRFEPDLKSAAIAMAEQLADRLGYVGVLAVEFFVTGDETTPLVINEIAPRVHNSGHWTMDACICGQFENHMRAVAGWPLGDPSRHSDATMTNLIGEDIQRWPELADHPGAVLHHYGKREIRPGRKLGHINHLKPR